MYQLLFRSRWFALAWGLMTAVSAVVFTTTGAGAVLTGTELTGTELTGTGAKQAAGGSAANKQTTPKAWARDAHADNEASEALDPDQGQDGVSGDSDGDARYKTVPFADSDSGTGDVAIEE